MKLSVMLPTRNGAAYLEDCLRSIVEQDADGVEIVVSDNASEDGTAEILATFAGDERLVLLRQPEPLSVAANWTAALDACTGDYIYMLGDDDFLLPGALSRMRELLEEWDMPDALGFEAYAFAFPGALDGSAPAHASERLFPYAPDYPVGKLTTERRRRSVEDFFHFEFTFCPNLQTTLLSRRALGLLRGPVFREPYPDFYAIYALLLLADRWARSDERLVVIGISPKSFGATLQREGSDAGRSYLGIDTEVPGGLPGADMINGTYLTLEKLKADYGPELMGIEISRSDYVYRQIYSWYLASRMGWIDRRELARRIRLLSARDIAGFARQMARRFDLGMVRRHARVDDAAAVESVWQGMRPVPEYATIREFASSVSDVVVGDRG